MQNIDDLIEIHVPPEQIFHWFLEIEKNYKLWHPDHISWEWIRGKPIRVGSRAIIKEYLHGKAHTLPAIITDIIENERIAYEFLFPFSLIVPGGSFRFTKTDTATLFTASLTFRSGGLLSKLFNNQLQAIQIHMREEGVSLKRLLEGRK